MRRAPRRSPTTAEARDTATSWLVTVPRICQGVAPARASLASEPRREATTSPVAEPMTGPPTQAVMRSMIPWKIV